MQVVIDTNLWVSFFIGKRVGTLKQRLQSPALKVLTCDVQRQELKRVLGSQKMQSVLGEGAQEMLLPVYDGLTEPVTVSEQVNACRDPKDNFLLSLALSARADLIVTGDKDLLVLHPFRGIHIVSYTEFEHRLTDL